MIGPFLTIGTFLVGGTLACWKCVQGCKFLTATILIVTLDVGRWLARQDAGSLVTLVISIGAFLLAAWDRLKNDRSRLMNQQINANRFLIETGQKIQERLSSRVEDQDREIERLRGESIQHELETVVASQEILRIRGILAPAEPAQAIRPRTSTLETVLLVEDDPSARSAMARLLKYYGFWVTPTASVEEAVEAIRARQSRKQPVFDFAIVDMMIPGGSGIDVIRRIREAGSTGIIVATGTNEEMALERVREMGVTVVMKPYVTSQILVPMGRKPAEPSPPGPGPRPPSPAPVDPVA